MIIKTINCAICGKTETETEPNAGWIGWSCFQGVELNGEPNPNICPVCTGKVMTFIDKESE
jgi:rubrerythrin